MLRASLVALRVLTSSSSGVSASSNFGTGGGGGTHAVSPVLALYQYLHQEPKLYNED